MSSWEDLAFVHFLTRGAICNSSFNFFPVLLVSFYIILKDLSHIEEILKD